LEKEVIVFYSWQSDLPGAENRYLISDAIEKAVKSLRDTVEVVADRDTKDVMGSPNIEETIFNKINNCDIFVADVSLVGFYEDANERKKYTPNANVLIELGYAIKVLGWDRIICIINTDYGSISELPFDISHHRVFSYSLKEKDKASIRNDIRDIVSTTVMDVLENGVRSKGDFASYIIGGYDFLTKTIKKELVKTPIEGSKYAAEYVENLKKELRKYIEKVLSISLKDSRETPEENSDLEENENESDLPGLKLDIFKKRPVIIKSEDIAEIKEAARKYFAIELDEYFFDLGRLEVAMSSIPMIGNQYDGTEDEKQKYELINHISFLLGRIELFELYLKTFEGMVLFNIAIWNTSSVADKDISIDISVNTDTAEIVPVDETLIHESLKEIAGLVYSEKIIEPLLSLKESADICDGSDYEQPPISAFIKQANVGMMVDPFGYAR